MPSFHSIRAICFDLDNTLWDVHEVLARAEAEVLRFLAERYPPIAAAETLETMRARRLAMARAAPERAHDFTWLRRESIRRIAIELGLPPVAGDEAFDVFFAWRNRVTLYDDVLPALEHLRSRYTLATLSNGNADLRHIGLGHLFALTLNAEGLGVAKPDARAFHAVADGLGLRPNEVAYVGDDPHFDVRGARDAGLVSVWIDRSGQAWPEGLERAPLEIRALSDLVRSLAGALND